MNKPKGLKYLKMNITYLFPTVDMSILVIIPKLAQFLKKISALTQKIIRKIFSMSPHKGLSTPEPS